jgi:hypothetical protein
MARSSSVLHHVLPGIVAALLAAPCVFAQQPADRVAVPPLRLERPRRQASPPVQPQPTTVPGRFVSQCEVRRVCGVAPLPFGDRDNAVPYSSCPKTEVELFASGIANARSMRLGDKGLVFVSNRLLDKVYAVVDKNGKRESK